MTREIVVTVVVTLIVGDLARSSRWSAARIARWAAARVYASDGERAARRAEEWDGLVSDSVPSDISAFCVGISLGFFAVACMAKRRAAGMASWCGRRYRQLSGRSLIRESGPGYLMDDPRAASLALLEAAHEFRLCLADNAPPSPGGTGGRLPTIRRLAADTQLRAANVALLGTGELGEYARKLGETAARLTDQAPQAVGGASQEAGVPDLSRLDRSIRAFQRCAIAASQDLAASQPAGPPESAGRTRDGT